MTGLLRYGAWLGAGSLLLAGCPADPVDGGTEGESSGSSGGAPTVSSSGMPSEDTTGSSGSSGSSDGSSSGTTTGSTGPQQSSSSEGSSGTSGVGPACAPECPTHELDVVIVVDNTASMGQDQRKLALAIPALMQQLQQVEIEEDLYLDLNLMVTTADFGNPLCAPFEPVGYEPARGAPISTACTSRLDDFTALGGMSMFPEACTDVCPAGVEPSDAFVHVVGPDDNVAAGSATEALQCLVPQGLVGCAYEAPLENMLQALNPGAEWNSGANPFLRPSADLAVVLLTDEMDCSILNYSIMKNPAYHNTNPATGTPAATSALCWNAGVSCDGPDGGGVYSNCAPTAGNGLQPTTRYTNHLVNELANAQGKDVVMLTLTGVPSVTAHSDMPPFEPTAGGVADLVYDQWQNGEYPMGDVIPAEWAVGVGAADKVFALGDAGPGCTGPDALGGHSQGQPPPRIQAVCEALDAQGGPHCCIESLCDADYDTAMNCLGGMIQQGI